MKLSDMQLFRGLEEDDIFSLLSCLNSVKRNYKKGEVYVAVALEIDPTWKKIGQLEKAN